MQFNLGKIEPTSLLELAQDRAWRNYADELDAKRRYSEQQKNSTSQTKQAQS